MTIFLILLCLVFSISASTVIPIDSHSFSDGQHPNSSDLNVISVDSRTFFNVPTVIPVDSQTFFDSEAKPRLTVIPLDSQTFFTGQTKPTHVSGFGSTIDYPKSSDLTVIPVNSQTFFNSEPKPPHVKAFSVTVKHPKPSDLTAIHIDSQTFFNHEPISTLLDSTVHHPKSSEINVIPIDSQTFFTSEPKPPRLDATVRHPKSSEINVMPVDTQTFFSSEPKPPRLDAPVSPSKSSGINVMPVESGTFFSSEPKNPHLDATVPTSESPNAIRLDSKTFLKSEPKYKDSASYCSVYLKKENLKKGAMLCPFFAPPSPTQESSIRSICEHGTHEKEFKFCSSSYQDISKKVTDKLGKNRLVSSARCEMNISIIVGIKKIAGYGQAVVCHKAQYVGFYCHQLGKSSVFSLSLTDLNGDRRKYVNMFAVCHEDTTSWNRNRLAFKILKAKPGDAICHLLPSYDLVWVALR